MSIVLFAVRQFLPPLAHPELPKGILHCTNIVCSDTASSTLRERYKYATLRYPMLPCDTLHYVTLRYATLALTYRVLASNSPAIIDMSYICTTLLLARNAHLLSTPHPAR